MIVSRLRTGSSLVKALLGKTKWAGEAKRSAGFLVRMPSRGFARLLVDTELFRKTDYRYRSDSGCPRRRHLLGRRSCSGEMCGMEKEKRQKSQGAAESRPEQARARTRQARGGRHEGRNKMLNTQGPTMPRVKNALSLLGNQACSGLGLERAPLLVLRSWHCWVVWNE